MGRIVVFVLAALSWGYALQPLALRRFWGWLLGTFLYLAKSRAPIVRQNLALAYPADERMREELAREAYTHLGNLVLEVLMLLGPMRRYVLQHGVLKGIEHWREAKAKGHGVIFLASHVGNWELMAATGGVHGGIDLMLVTKHLKPEWLHQAIESGRRKCGVDATYEPKTMRDVLRQLRDGGTVGIVLDQYAGAPIGVRVPVFGVPVGTSNAIAMIARRTGAAVLPVVNHRQADGRVVVEIRAPLAWIEDEDPARALALNTAHYSMVLERDIREFPSQWLWIHRRFKGDLSPLREGEWTEGRART